MKLLTKNLPSFHETEVNKRLDESCLPTGEIIPHQEVIMSNVSSSIKAALEHFGEADGTVIFLCVSQKTKDDYLTSISAIPIDENDRLTEITVCGDNMPTLFVSNKGGIIDIIRRVLKNIAFS